MPDWDELKFWIICFAIAWAVFEIGDMIRTNYD